MNQLPALAHATAPQLCVVIPVLNERDNIAPLVARLNEVLAGIAWEAIFVDDDSTDGTREAVRAVAQADPRVRLLHRIGRRGLSSAFIEGAQASLAPYIAAMDGDMQHDETLLPHMLAALRDDGYELAIGSRYVAGGGVGDWDATRAGLSTLATRVSQVVLRVQLSDPMSGFFMIRRETFDRAARRLSAMGFKILLDIVASLPSPPRLTELPYKFRSRVHGDSKMDAGVLRDYALLLLDKLVGHIVPVRFVLFAGVGLLGIAAHLLVLRIGLLAGLDFAEAQSVATGVAIVGNFVLNNLFTFRDRRLRGWRFLRGLVTFALICSVGAVGNLSVSIFLFGPGHSSWWVAGLAGAAMSLVWNYAASSVLTWRK
ncbi:MAG: dolichol monophosphate mannose synthase [Acetobacteraceae bacterium SCN 69-10]|nr:glycosyltransferase family 2 protein [Rhodospirillales bacterium]ODU61977.1 MAG: dolichol monophosphate mannose synthase [Acetobacteraceae bacterium SCN 69-10]OJY65788.1 MAG: dolichol monophosphate mannose synthase [Rhodospirillales bacterium 70-18]